MPLAPSLPCGGERQGNHVPERLAKIELGLKYLNTP